MEQRKDSQKGIKFDGEKLEWDLLPFETVEEVIKVLMHGKEKYSADNWKYVPEFHSRYKNALQRHVAEYMKGKRVDESGLPTLAHLICNAIFLLWAELNPEEFEKCQNKKSNIEIHPYEPQSPQYDLTGYWILNPETGVWEYHSYGEIKYVYSNGGECNCQ